mmetsp:Transcript_3906/g.9309  ORF Transcript_3906/g.9309 Transcript_3906/m.9309 type:complete len:308 (+) Transcript_3906:121-1044(+)|eukprot:CAMPEP_0116102918 /NCGR_PEP_ID=MMETSP0327-20121206/13609_1 /TAXON_ID=44447 /ORGANISM="Pseudo-nitzschia delicatissima, Strain B596" /LENGTH=307 /DNA_ID=CAMNT_0003594997 /DNA_START=92 /DNA_END=1015 /DNA_ORIENTATION=+
MKFCGAILVSLLFTTEAFAPQQLSRAPTALSVGPGSSRIEGNQREPSDQEKKLMDEMVMKLANAKPYELPNAVRRAFRVVSSPQFFMRIATLSDKAEGEEKEKLAALASNLVATLEVVVETTEETLDERAKDVEKVLKAAAEPETGDFLVPLLPQQVQAMRKVVEGLEPSSLDEGFLSTVDAFMNKSHQDGMDGMVEILQKCLQQYSGVSIKRARSNADSEGDDDTSSEASKLFDKLLEIDTDAWDDEIKSGVASSDDLTTQKLTVEIQKTMETVVLGLENGSMAQRVQAEYLRELVTRVEAIEANA